MARDELYNNNFSDENNILVIAESGGGKGFRLDNVKYRYVMCGMFDGLDGESYSIEIPSPFIRNSETEAMDDSSFAYRFVFDGEVKIVCFEKENIKADRDENNNKCLITWVDGDILGTYTYQEFLKNGGSIKHLKPESRSKICIDDTDFEDTEKTFADIFKNIKLYKLYYIDDEAYYVKEM